MTSAYIYIYIFVFVYNYALQNDLFVKTINEEATFYYNRFYFKIAIYHNSLVINITISTLRRNLYQRLKIR